MHAIIQTPTSDLSKSQDFYKKLGFTFLSDSDPCIVSDGSVIIEINPERYARAALILKDTSWQDVAEQLEKITDLVETNDGYLINDPSGGLIYLVETEDFEEFESVEKSSSLLGTFAGISFETIAIKRSIEIWKVLGFTKEQGDVSQGWVSLSNEDGFGVSFMIPNMCPHLFFNPSLTYFNGKDNIEIISKIRKLEIPITEEITVFNTENIVDNIIIRDPGGYGFFIFSD